MDAARLEWTARKEDELNRVLETASSQLVEQFEEQKKEALETAIGEARVRTQKATCTTVACSTVLRMLYVIKFSRQNLRHLPIFQFSSRQNVRCPSKSPEFFPLY